MEADPGKHKGNETCAKAKQNDIKTLQKYHRVPLVLPNYSWTWGLVWSVVKTPSELEEGGVLCMCLCCLILVFFLCIVF